MRRFLTLSAMILTLAGCSGEFYRTVKLQPGDDSGTSIVTDARLRVISNVEPGAASRPGQVDPTNIICVEPSPDVAVAVANSFGLGVGVAGKGSGSLSAAAAEGLAQIAERTTAIQAILRQGYQSCIDYQNGAINGTTYSLRQSRLDDLLVTLVLAEDAAGAFGRSGAFIGTEASSSARAAATFLPEINKSMDQASSDLAAAEKEVAKAERERQDAQTALDKNTDPAQQTALEAELKAKDAALKTAIAQRDLALRRVTGLTEAASNAAAGVSEIAGHGGIEAKPDPDIARVIGQMQETFVNKDVEQAYLSACLIELGQWKVRDDEDDLVRKAAQTRLNAVFGDKDADGPKDDDWGDYFLATQIGQHTLLTDICQVNLAPFVFRAQANAQDRKLKQLDIEAKRVELALQESQQAEPDVGEGIHPLKAMNAAGVAKSALDKARSELPAVPAISTSFPKEQKEEFDKLRATADAESKKISDAIAELTTQRKDEVAKLESDFIQLIADPRRNGSREEQEIWTLAFEAQQKQAAFVAKLFTNVTGQAKTSTAALQDLKRRIDAIGK